MIQKLSYKDDTYIIGLSEIVNSRGFGVNQLLDLVKVHSENVLAVQFFNSNLVASDLHLISAAQNAINAWRGNYMISRSLDVEIIVYASAQRQIHQALDLLGVRDGLSSLTLVVVGTSEERVAEVIEDMTKEIGDPVDPPFLPSEEKISHLMKVFDITRDEMQYFLTTNTLNDLNQALTKCIVSRVSLVAIGA